MSKEFPKIERMLLQNILKGPKLLSGIKEFLAISAERELVLK